MTDDIRPDQEELQELLGEENIQAAKEAAEQAAKESNGQENTPKTLDFLYDIPLQVSVEVGRSKILLRDLLQMGDGYVIELDKLAGEPLDLYVNSRLIARGEAVMVGDKFGIRLTDVVSTFDRLTQLS